LVITAGGFASLPALSFAQQTPTARERCLLEAIKNAGEDTTIGALRESCDREPEPPGEVTEAPEKGVPTVRVERQQAEQAAHISPFLIAAHRPNYGLVATYNFDPNDQPFQESLLNDDDASLSNVEAMFQLSFKIPIITNMFWGHGDVFFAYTQRSFWQVYNTDLSSPFRENDFEPEAFLSFDTNWGLWGWKNSLISLGINHQSNGRSEPLSRGWNRVFAQIVVDNPKYNLYFSLKPWFVFSESSGNPDIERFMGHGELLGVYKHKDHTFGLQVRNNLRSESNRGGYQLDWSFPLYKRWRGYIQYFNGYGYSLIDYNRNQNVIGIGVQVSDYF
jgi:phospholipase A1